MQPQLATAVIAAIFAVIAPAMAQGNPCGNKLEHVIETRKEGNKTIRVCVCNDGLVRSAQTQKCVKTKPLKANAEGDVSIKLADGRTLKTAEIDRASKDAKVSSALFSTGANVTTGADSTYEVTLSDSTVVNLGSNSILAFEKVEFGSDGKLSRLRADLKQGTLYWKRIAERATKSRYEIGVRLVSLGVRGTEFEAMLAASGAGHVKLHSGQLDVTDKSGNALFTMTAGKQVIFDSAGQILGPSPMQ